MKSRKASPVIGLRPRICLSSLLVSFGATVSMCGQGQTNVATTSEGNPPIHTAVWPDVMRVAEPSGRTLHLEVGHTLLLDAQNRVNRIYVGNPAVLESYIATPKQILLTAKATGVSSVMLWDEKNHMESYIVSGDLDLDPLRHALTNALPNEAITLEVHQGGVMLVGTVTTQAVADTAEKMATLFSKDVINSLVVNSARARQVQLKVRFVEVDRSRLNQFGINIFAPGGSTTIGSGTTSQFGSIATLTSGSGGGGSLVGSNTLAVSNPLNFLFYNSKANIGVSVEDLESKQMVQILSEPTITTLNGQSASFLAGGEFPFPVVQGSSTGTTSITIQFRPYGVKLAFTPKVNVDGTIELKVAPEVSALDFTNAVSISGYTIPAISSKRVDTQVVLRSGQSFAISGLLDRRTTDSLSRTPGIANVPLLGALFRSKGINLSTSELIIVVTPTLIDPLTESATPAEPATVRPFLDKPKFDSGIPAVHKPDTP